MTGNHSFIKDLLWGPGNEAWDLGRIAVATGVVLMLVTVIWNMLLGLPIELGPAGFLGGMGAFFTGCAALIYAKDRAKAENTVAVAMKEGG